MTEWSNQSKDVEQLQRLLTDRGYAVEANGVFDESTLLALRAFQSQNLDQHGTPLRVDGILGPLTWWSLTHPKPEHDPLHDVYDFTTMPPAEAGGSPAGR